MTNMKPVLFNTDMVSALLDGRKTVTRRAVKPQPQGRLVPERSGCWPGYFVGLGTSRVVCPPYFPGDILYVRETWAAWSRMLGTTPTLHYKADGDTPESIKWRPSIHMPREAARIFLRVTDVRVERLRDITETQAIAEGLYKGWSLNEHSTPAITPIQAFMWVWNMTMKPADRALYGWAANPWVWVIEFERISKEKATG